MKIMLISSIVTHSAQTNPEWTAENDVGDFPPIGLMYIAGYLRNYAPHHVIKLLDANLLSYTQEDIRKEVMSFQPEVVGMTVYTDILFDCLETMKVVKSVSKDIYMVVGGAHPNKHIEETKTIPEVDFICLGEGEILFAELIDALEGKRDVSNIKGLVRRDTNGKFVENGGTNYIEDLNSLPYPAFDLLPFKKYYSIVGTGSPVGVICSSRGCPFKCTYCSKLYDTYRGRSPENIIGEIKLYYDKGIREFMFFDDMFNLPAKRALDVSKMLRENFKDIQWSFRGRADQITEELAKELRESKCILVTLGAEAHKDEIQKELRTGKRIEYIKRAVKFLRKNKIKVNTNWIIGLPQHKSAKDIEELLTVIFEIDSDYVQFAILMLWDDTELYREAVKRKIIDPKIWEDFIKKPTEKMLIPAWEEHMSRKEQSELLRHCYVKFYLRPKVIYRQLMSIRSWKMFETQFKGFVLILIPLFYPLIRFFVPDLSRRKKIHKLD